MDFKVIEGVFPILLSAPHAAPHLRPGFGFKKPKLNEPNTDIIVEMLCQKVACFGIYTTKLQKLDPNWYKDSPYKKAIKKLAEENNIQFALDIHGARTDKPFIIEYNDFKSGKDFKTIKENLLRCFKKYGFSKNEIKKGLLRKDKQQTITEFCIERLKIPALQLELNRKIRNPQNQRFHYLLSSLECFIDTLKLVIG